MEPRRGAEPPRPTPRAGRTGLRCAAQRRPAEACEVASDRSASSDDYTSPAAESCGEGPPSTPSPPLEAHGPFDSGEYLAAEEALFRDNDSLDRAYDGTFEGPEKTLEVCFRPGVGRAGGCRNLPRGALDRVLRRARCTILSQISNEALDAYVLSESSLFVYPHKMVLKTCGTTTLLRCLPLLLHEARERCGCELEWVGYSRKNYIFPGSQLFPHTSFSDEMGYLQKHSRYYDRLSGSAHILGPLTGDHWFVYVADKCERPAEMATDRTINVMMFDLHPDAAAIFYKERYATAAEQTQASGIRDLIPDAQIDAAAFEPCGYSMNAILNDSYSTVHITPESECSYASFETNKPLQSYATLVEDVLRLFRPRRFVLTMFADDASLASLHEDPFEAKSLDLPRYGTYVRSNAASSTTLETDTVCRMGCWELASERMPKKQQAGSVAATFATADT